MVHVRQLASLFAAVAVGTTACGHGTENDRHHPDGIPVGGVLRHETDEHPQAGCLVLGRFPAEFLDARG